MTASRRIPFVAFAALLLAVTSCAPQATPTVTPPTSGGTPAVISGKAPVESIDIRLLESFPVQVHVIAHGYLPDGCTTIDQTTQVREGNTFRVAITTSRPAGVSCTEAIVPFDQTIALEVYGLKAGTYTIDVNGVRGAFTLDADNVPQG